MNQVPIMGKGGMPKGGGVPDRWEIYSNIGQIVKGTRFVPFKVPLNEDLLNKVPEGVDRNWGLEHLKLACPKLSLIVDLTNTKRYYSGVQAEEMGFKYVKIMTKGHEVPDNQVVKKFYRAVREALEEDKEGIVGVHCTHGLNRTGYLVCRYMVEKLSMEPDVAIKAFNTARGHVQERANYLEHLRGRIWEKTNFDHDNIESQEEPMTYGQYKRMNERQNPSTDTQSYTSAAGGRESHYQNNYNQYGGRSYSGSQNSVRGHPYTDEWREQSRGRGGHVNEHREGVSSYQGWNSDQRGRGSSSWNIDQRGRGGGWNSDRRGRGGGWNSDQIGRGGGWNSDQRGRSWKNDQRGSSWNSAQRGSTHNDGWNANPRGFTRGGYRGNVGGQWNNSYSNPHNGDYGSHGNSNRNDSNLDHRHLHENSNRNEGNSDHSNSHSDRFNTNHYNKKSSAESGTPCFSSAAQEPVRESKQEEGTSKKSKNTKKKRKHSDESNRGDSNRSTPRSEIKQKPKDRKKRLIQSEGGIFL